jgi:hypothetical protein
LIGALDGRPCAIHIDAKSDIYEEVAAKLGHAKNVTFLPRHNCYWGGFGHVRASLKGLHWFRQLDCDHAILLTGQCYPLQSIEKIERDLAGLHDKSIIQHFPLPHSEWRYGGLDRIDRYFFNIPLLSRRSSIKFWQRKMPYSLTPFGGGGYWCMSRKHVDYILEYEHTHPRLNFFESTLIPDELYFQTILCNSEYKNELIKDQIHYIEWEDDSPNPNILREATAALSSGKWFARKFEDASVLDVIDAYRRAQSAHAL